MIKKKEDIREVIDNLLHLKQKESEDIEEFFEKVIQIANKYVSQSHDVFKKIWFLNGLKREVSKYIALLPTNTLEEVLWSIKKVELSIYRNKKNLIINTLKIWVKIQIKKKKNIGWRKIKLKKI